MRKLHIGVMGSMADLNYTKEVELIAERVGELIAEEGGILVFGAEKDSDSLSTVACRGAKRKGGLTVGITYGKGKKILQSDADVIIPTGMERGGGREFVLALSCDAVVAMSGGFGILNELTVAYQACMPMVVVSGMGGWSDKLAGQLMDNRQRQMVLAAESPEQAVSIAFSKAREYVNKYE